MSYCYCDFESPSLFTAVRVKSAKKTHKCRECGRKIEAGEPYENVWGIWEGRPEKHKTCQHCLSLRDFVEAHVPCVCWAYGDMRETAIEAAQAWAHETVGLLFGAWRREALIRRARAAARHD